MAEQTKTSHDVAAERVDDNGITHIEVFKDDKVISDSTFDKDGKPIADLTFENGRISSQMTYGPDGKKAAYKAFDEKGNYEGEVFDGEGRVIQTTEGHAVYDADLKESCFNELVYDQNQQLVSRETTFADGSKYQINHTTGTAHHLDAEGKEITDLQNNQTTAAKFYKIVEETQKRNNQQQDQQEENTEMFSGSILPAEENTGKEESIEDLNAQMWRLAWKNKFFGFEYDEDKNGKFPFVQCNPETIKHEAPPPRVTMELKDGAKLTNSSNGINLDYSGDPKPEDFMTMVRLGQEKGWKSARIDPDSPAEFKANMYIAMKAMGMNVSNIKELGFTDKEIAKLDKEAEQTAKKYGPTLNKTAEMDANYPALDAARREAQGKKGDQEAFNDITAKDYKDLKKAVSSQRSAEQIKQPAEKEEVPKTVEVQENKPKTAVKEDVSAKKPETLSQSMQKVVSEMAKANGVELGAKDSKETTKAAAKMSRGIKSLPPELQEKFGKVVGNLVENHPDIAKQLVVDLNSNGKQGPARVVKAYSNALNRVREAEAKGQKSTTRQTEQQKQDMTNKIISGIKKNSRG